MGKMVAQKGRFFTPAEQRVLSALPSFGRIDIETACKAFSEAGLSISKSYLSEILSRLAKKKALLRIEKGVFFAGITQPNAHYAIGLALCPRVGAYVAFASALYFYHFIDEMPFVVSIANRSKSKRAVLNNTEYELIAIGEKCAGAVEKDGVLVSSKAKTIFDCFLHPEHCGGFNKVLGAFKTAAGEFSESDWKELVFWIEEFASAALEQRIGFASRKTAPSFFVKRLLSQARKSKTISLFHPYERKGVFDSQWKVIAEERGVMA